MLLETMLPFVLAAGPTRPGPEAAAVLHAWDDRRAAAWSAADPAALRALYVPGAAVGRSDLAMLRAWSARGVRVDDLRMQLLRVDVRRASSGRLQLVVTDRLARAVAVGHGWRRVLPADRPTTRRVTLVRVAGEWRVADVRPVG